MQLTVKVDDKQIKLKMQKLGKAIPNITNKIMAQRMELAKKEASGFYSGGNSYRVKRLPNQKYIRTGTYGSGFSVFKKKSLSYQLRSTAPYTRYVGGDNSGNGQARIHLGRWAIIFDVLQKHAQKLVADMEAAYKKYIRQEGMGL